MPRKQTSGPAIKRTRMEPGYYEWHRVYDGQVIAEAEKDLEFAGEVVKGWTVSFFARANTRPRAQAEWHFYDAEGADTLWQAGRMVADWAQTLEDTEDLGVIDDYPL